MEPNNPMISKILDDKDTEITEPIKEINIGEYKYKYKDKYKKGYCYRCVNRASCKLTIVISFEDYKRIINKKEKEANINYVINSKQQEHTCKIKLDNQISTNDIKKKEEEYQFAINLIKHSIDEPPLHHYNNSGLDSLR